MPVKQITETYFQVYFHAPEDVPFINSDPDQRKDVMLGESANISINVRAQSVKITVLKLNCSCRSSKLKMTITLKICPFGRGRANFHGKAMAYSCTIITVILRVWYSVMWKITLNFVTVRIT